MEGPLPWLDSFSPLPEATPTLRKTLPHTTYPPGVPIDTNHTEITKNVFKHHFGHLNELCVNSFSCACQTEKDRIIHQGRLYITRRYLCFHSHVLIFGQPYIQEIALYDVVAVQKRMTAFFFPAISVELKNGSLVYFSSFLQRHRAFVLINYLIEQLSNDNLDLKTLIKQESASKPIPDESLEEADEMVLHRHPSKEFSDSCVEISSTNYYDYFDDLPDSFSQNEKRKEEKERELTTVGDKEFPPIGKIDLPIVSQSIEEYFSISSRDFYTNYLLNSSFWDHLLSMRHFHVRVPCFLKPLSLSPNPFDNYFIRTIEFSKSILHSQNFPHEQIQRIRMINDDEFIFDTSNTTANSFEPFIINTYWHIAPDGLDCKVIFRVEVALVKSRFLKKRKEQKLIKNSEQFFLHFAREVQLDLAKQSLDIDGGEGEDAFDDEEEDEEEEDEEDDEEEEDELDSEEEEEEGYMNRMIDNNNDNISEGNNNYRGSGLEGGNGAMENFLRFFEKIFTELFENKLTIYSSLLLILFLFLAISLQTLRIHWAEERLIDWQRDYHVMENRLSFLQIYTATMANYLTGDDKYVEDNWKNWKETKGAFWRYVEWYSQALSLRNHLQQSLFDLSLLLSSSSSYFPSHFPPIPSFSSSQIKSSHLPFIDNEKVYLSTEEEGKGGRWRRYIFVLLFILLGVSIPIFLYFKM